MNFKKLFVLIFLTILLSPIFVQNLTMAQREENYCPENVDPQYCHKVIIIGAGMAGLGAAKELQSHGYDFVILEEAVAGGRVTTKHACFDNGTINDISKCVNGTKINYDTHASFISGYDGNPIYDLSMLYNKTDALKGHILLKTSDYTNSVLYDQNGPVDKKRQTDMSQTYDKFKEWSSTQAEKMSHDESLQKSISEFNKTQNLSGINATDFTYEISSNIGSEYANDPSDMSWKYWDKIGYRPGGDNAVDKVFPNGFGDIITGLVNDVGEKNIVDHTSVTEIDYDDHGVKVKTSKNSVYYGQYVISTVPPHVIGSITFVPPIPTDKLDAINQMSNNMGTLAQTYFYFKKPVFWDDVDWIYYIPPMTEAGQFVNIQNMYRVSGVPMLLVYNYGDYAQHMTHPKENISHLIDVLSKIYPEKVSKTDKTKVTDDDVLMLYPPVEPPSYSSIPVNFKVPDGFNLLKRSLIDSNNKSRVFFAGEATTWHYPQTTHGAYLTGLREANSIMFSDKGYYPSPHVQLDNWRYPSTNTTGYSWKTYPEYIICNPESSVLVIKNDAKHSPLCVMPSHIDALEDRHFILDPLKADPTSN